MITCVCGLNRSCLISPSVLNQSAVLFILLVNSTSLQMQSMLWVPRLTRTGQTYLKRHNHDVPAKLYHRHHVAVPPCYSARKSLTFRLGPRTRDNGQRHLSVSSPVSSTQEVLTEYTSLNQQFEVQDWDVLDRDEDSQAEIVLQGYVTGVRRISKGHFVQLVDPTLKSSVQTFISNTQWASLTGLSTDEAKEDLKRTLDKLTPHTPVAVRGYIVAREDAKLGRGTSNKMQDTQAKGKSSADGFDPHIGHVRQYKTREIQVSSITPLNYVPPTTTIAHGSTHPAESRHLTLRSDQELRQRLEYRSILLTQVMRHFHNRGFVHVETPLLFKSTPEGAREFIVPTRKRGFAYALPQSPQQYKQALMAAGIRSYFQIARCFRDEDRRADRQPEFTQLDLESAFATSADVMKTVEGLFFDTIWGEEAMAQRTSLQTSQLSRCHLPGSVFPVLTYQDAMQRYGSDKPDPRWGAEIKDVTGVIPPDSQSMLTSLPDPIIEMINVRLADATPTSSRSFVSDFMRLPSSAHFSDNPEGMPGIAVYDPSAPLRGLQAYGFEAADHIETLLEPEPGDILITQARPRAPFFGGSTILGQIRQRIHEYAVEESLLPAPDTDSIMWVVDFPLFSPVDATTAAAGEGQSGRAGICSTHHPFTAPKHGQDLSKLISEPLSIIGDHYDLVINGQEIGGGSRRIHHGPMQELIFREVLQMPAARVEDFRHLLTALGDGCPPHAGFALGFDRLCATLCNVKSVRDVLAFPKDGQGREAFVGSPCPIVQSQLNTYHLKISDTETSSLADSKLSQKA